MPPPPSLVGGARAGGTCKSVASSGALRRLAATVSLAAALAATSACAPEAEEGDAGSGRAASPNAPAPRVTSGAGDELPRLAARLELPVAGKPEGVLLADLDGDGALELACVSKAPGTLTVWRRPPRGFELWSASRAAPVGDYALGPVLLRGAEGARVALASRATEELELHDAGAPDGPRRVATLPLGARPRALCAGDLDGDGSDELACLDEGGRLLVLGGAELAGASGTLAGLGRALAVGDGEATCALVLAGGAGVAVGFQGARTVRRFAPSPEDALVLRPAEELALDGVPRALLELDVDGDGDRELVVAGGDDDLWVFGVGGAGAWSGEGEPVRREGPSIPLRLAAADVDAGGGADLCVLHHRDLVLNVLCGLGTGAPTRELALYAGQTPWDLAAGDWNGDGRPELVVANRDAGRVGLLFGAPGGGLLDARALPAGRAPSRVALGDLDGDGRPEAAVLSALDGALALYPNRDGILRDGPRLPAGPGASNPRVADVDGDGAVEVLWTTRDAAGARLVALTVRGPDPARFPRSASEVLGPSADDLLLADLDGDGRDEALVADGDGGAVHVATPRPGAGADELVLAGLRSLALDGRPVALARLGAGRAPRVAVALDAGPGASRVAFLAPDGAGGLRTADETPLPLALVPRALAAGDLDGDGERDLAALAAHDMGDGKGLVQAWLRRGDGWVALPPQETGLRPYALVAGDLDADGRADLVASAQNSHRVELWLARDGDPLRLARCADLGAGTGPLGLALGDLDGDGGLDLVVANSSGDTLSVIASR